MACWRERVGIRRRLFLSEGFVAALVVIGTCFNLLPKSYTQEGFPSIDYDYLGVHYGDGRNFPWFADYGRSMKTGNSSQQPALYPNEGDVTYISLGPVVGARFISSAELRLLDTTVYSYTTIYSYSGSQMQHLPLLHRCDLATKNSTLSVRLPGDKLDRIRKFANELPMAVSVCYLNSSDTVISIQTLPDDTTKADIYHVPRIVMQNGWLMSNVLTNINSFSTNGEGYGVGYYEAQAAVVFPLYTDYLYLTPAERFFSVIYARYLISSALRNFPTKVVMNGVPGPVLNFHHQATMQATRNFLLSSNKIAIEMTFGQRLSCEWSPPSPVINILEGYGQYFLNCTKTYSSDGKLVGWSVVSVDLIANRKASLHITSWQGYSYTPVTHDWLSFTHIEVIDKEGFIAIPCRSNGTHSYSMQLQYCRMHDSPFLNSISTVTALRFPDDKFDRIWNVPYEISSFATSMLALQELDLSFNARSYVLVTWGKTTLKSLDFLNCSHNQLQAKLSSLDEYLDKSTRQVNNGFLRRVQFNYMRRRNLIAGYDKLQEVAAQNSSTRYVTPLLFSFENNNITVKFPDADAFEGAMGILQKMLPSYAKGILLGGNPYCKSAKSDSERYLCRYTIYDEVPRKQRSKSYVLIISIFSASVGLLLCCVAYVTLRKLYKQVKAPGDIQQAFADRQVHPLLYQYGELKLATRDFHNDRKLGRGAFGAVYKGVLADETKLAVKKLFNSKRLQVLNEFLNEVVLITGIKHRNLIQLKGCCINDKHRILVYEYAENGNLAQALWGSNCHGGLNWEQRFNICVGVARGLSYLHEELQPCIVHRDIKPENILLDENFKPKIADFGLARHYSSETSQAYYTTRIVGTLGYFAPEHISEGQISDRGDVYSYGIVVLEIVSGRKCIDHSLPRGEIYLKDWVRKLQQMGLLFDVLQLELRGSCVVAEVIRAIKIALLCVQYNPDMRPSMSQIVTMFSGNLDVDAFLNEPISPDVQDIMVTLDSDLEDLALDGIVEEDCATFFLRSTDSQSSSGDTKNGRAGSRSPIELSTICGQGDSSSSNHNC